MFDTITGLPVHALLVHAVVVLLPLTAVAAIVVALRPSWRVASGPIAVLAGIMVLVSLATKESGEVLQQRLASFSANGTVPAQEHGEQGELIPWVALALFAATGLVWFSGRRPGLAKIGAVVVVLAGLGAIGWTVVVGDSGARAVWGS